MSTFAKRLQSDMKDKGFYQGKIDGVWGNGSQAAWEAILAAASQRNEVPMVLSIPTSGKRIAWSAKVSPKFIDKVVAICRKLGIEDPSDLMACMAWETGETFSPSVVNGAGSKATGLIQFMPTTAKGLGTSSEALAEMTAEEQLEYVYKYFLPYKGRLKNVGDVYMAILWPAGIGKKDDYVLWTKDKRPTTYLQNKGLDVNKDGAITRAECIKKVIEKKEKGLSDRYVR